MVCFKNLVEIAFLFLKSEIKPGKNILTAPTFAEVNSCLFCAPKATCKKYLYIFINNIVVTNTYEVTIYLAWF